MGVIAKREVREGSVVLDAPPIFYIITLIFALAEESSQRPGPGCKAATREQQ